MSWNNIARGMLPSLPQHVDGEMIVRTTDGGEMTLSAALNDPRNVHNLTRNALYQRARRGPIPLERLWKKSPHAVTYTLTTGEMLSRTDVYRDPRNIHRLSLRTIARRLVDQGIRDPEQLWAPVPANRNSASAQNRWFLG